jgi:N-methylhydantoinase A
LREELLGWYVASRSRLLEGLRSDGIPRSRARVVASADCRYLGQGFELQVPLPGFHARGIGGLTRRFHQLHEATYGHADPTAPVEVVTVRSSAFGELDKPEPSRLRRGIRTPPDDAIVGTRATTVPGMRARTKVAVYRRELLRAGNRLTGPAVIEQMDATTVVLPGHRADVDPYGDLWIRKERRR